MSGRRSEHLDLLRRLVTIGGAPADVDAVLERTLTALTGITGHEISSLHLVSTDGRSLDLYGDRGLAAPLRDVNRALPIGEGLIGRVALSGRHVRLERVTLSPYLLPAARDIVRAEGIRGFVCVPIRTPREVFGTLSLGRRIRAPFTADDVRLLEVAAGHIATTVETARRQAEIQRRQLEAVETVQAGFVDDVRPSARATEEAVGRIADELRTSHRSMLGWVRLLRESTGNATLSAHGLDVLERQLASQTQLLSDLLDLVRIATGRLPCDRRPIDVVTVLEQAVDRARAIGESRGVAVDFVTDVAACPVIGDPLRLEQVVLTLVAEALARAQSPSRILVHLWQEGDAAHIAVGESARALSLGGSAERGSSEAAISGRCGVAIARYILALHGGTMSIRDLALDLPLRRS